jgi:transcriptional regulator with XRE-family HTH domain
MAIATNVALDVVDHPLRRYRRDLGASLDDLAGLTGVSAGTLSKVERGRCGLRPQTKLLIARRLGARVGDLFPIEPVATP